MGGWGLRPGVFLQLPSPVCLPPPPRPVLNWCFHKDRHSSQDFNAHSLPKLTCQQDKGRMGFADINISFSQLPLNLRSSFFAICTCMLVSAKDMGILSESLTQLEAELSLAVDAEDQPELVNLKRKKYWPLSQCEQ